MNLSYFRYNVNIYMFFVNIMYALHLPTERSHPLYPTCQHSTIHQNYCWPPCKPVARVGIVLTRSQSCYTKNAYYLLCITSNK